MKNKKLIKEILGCSKDLDEAEAKILVFNKIYGDLSVKAKKRIENSLNDSDKTFSIKRFDTTKDSFMVTEFVISDLESFRYYREAKDLIGEDLKDYIYSDNFRYKGLNYLNAIELNVHEFKNNGYKIYNTIYLEYSIGSLNAYPDHTLLNELVATEKLKEFLLKNKACKLISEEYNINNMLKNIIINEEYNKLEYMIRFNELILLEVEGHNDIVDAITSQHFIKPIEFYSMINKIEDKLSLNNVLGIINKNKDQIDGFVLLEEQQSPNLLYNTLYSIGVIEEMIEKFGEVDEEVTTDAINVVYSNIRYMVDNKRSYTLDLQKLFKEIIRNTTGSLEIIPVIEYLGRLTEYQGIQAFEAISVYGNYLRHVKYTETILDSLDKLFPSSIKKSIRKLNIENVDVSNAINIIELNGLDINKTYEYRGYKLIPLYKEDDFIKIIQTFGTKVNPNHYITLSIYKDDVNVGVLQVSITKSSCFAFSQIPLREHIQVLKKLTDINELKTVLPI